MSNIEKFEFERSRGVVWVCDLESSSKYLNDNKSVDDLEQFLPRLYWTAAMIVEAAGGRFIKWTGDGFMAWFESPLHRTLGQHAGAAFTAAWHITVLVNVTQLGLKPQHKFRLRHGITYEEDALLIKVTRSGGQQSLDLLGRSVVLAFRLSSIPTDFPGIVTQKELVIAGKTYCSNISNFKKWQISPSDKLKYFKGEKWGTASIYTSSGKVGKSRSLSALLKGTKKVIAKAEGAGQRQNSDLGFAKLFLSKMESGPDWCQDVIKEYLRYIKDDLLGTLKKLLSALELAEDAKTITRNSIPNKEDAPAPKAVR